MFYSQVILARKGPLGKIWLAAHFEKKLTKQQIFATDITQSVQSVINPTVPLALRVSGHLMLGIVRIYSKKVKYLVSDCTEAMTRMQMAFRPGNVDVDPLAADKVVIDDLRHFGNIRQLEDDDRLGGGGMLAFTAFERPMEAYSPSLSAASPKGMPRMDTSISQISDIGMEAAEARRFGGSMGFAGRSPMTRPGSLLPTPAPFAIEEDNLPAFDDKVFGTSADFGMPSMLEEGYGYEMPAPEPMALPPTPLGAPAPAMALRAMPAVEEEEEEAAAAAPARKAKPKRKQVVLDERTEIPERTIRARIEDPSAILRRPKGAAPEEVQGPKGLTVEERLQQLPAYTSVAPQLRWTIDVLSGALPMPFAAIPAPAPAPIPTPVAVPSPAHVAAAPPTAPTPQMPTPVDRGRASMSIAEESMGAAGMADYGYEMPSMEMPTPIGFVPLGAEGDDLAAMLSQPAPPATAEEVQHRMSDRTKNVLHLLNAKAQAAAEGQVSFNEVVQRATKKSAAVLFLEALQLKTFGLIDMEQAAPFADIIISPAGA